MSQYGVLLFVHVLAVVVWVGGAVMYHVLIDRAVTAGDPVRTGGLLRDSEYLAKHYYMPASLTTLVFGILLVLKGEWGWTEPFVVVGIVGILATIVTGIRVLGPASQRLGEHIASHGIDDGARSQGDRLKMVSRVDLLILVLVIFMMTVKPGT